jgi:hypothetical protein
MGEPEQVFTTISVKFLLFLSSLGTGFLFVSFSYTFPSVFFSF